MKVSALNPWIALLTVPALAYFAQLTIEASMAPGELYRSSWWSLIRLLPLLHGWVWISPLFVCAQALLWRRNVDNRTVANGICIALTSIAALRLWASQLAFGGF